MADAVRNSVVGGLCATSGALAYVVVHLVGQQGRLLLRVEVLEKRLAEMEAARGAEREPLAVPSSLPVGSKMPAFRLPDLDGEMMGLEDLRGSSALLVHWDPQCGFCQQIAPDLARVAEPLKKHRIELVLVSYGDVDANRRLIEDSGLECRVLLQGGRVLQAFAGSGTPVAYLVDGEGRVMQPLAVGAVEVPLLAQAAARGKNRLETERPLADSRILRDGLPAGTPAPSFTLPDLDGDTVSWRTIAAAGCCSCSATPSAARATPWLQIWGDSTASGQTPIRPS